MSGDDHISQVIELINSNYEEQPDLDTLPGSWG